MEAVTATRLGPRRASLILGVAKCLVLGLVLVSLVLGFATQTISSAETPSALRLDVGARDLQRAMTKHECSETGFGGRAAPLSALIRLDGQLRHVSFDQAWSVFTGAEPGKLLAVCLSELVREGPVAASS